MLFSYNTLHLSPTLRLVLCDENAAREMANNEPDDAIYIAHQTTRGLEDSHYPCKLGQIYWFCNMISQTASDLSTRRVVICADGEDADMITTCAMLLGSYMILCKCESLENVTCTFFPISTLFTAFHDESRHRSENLTVQDCWQALASARHRGWIDFLGSMVDIDLCLDMHEFLHYDNPANGGFHVLIPSELLICPSPADLPQPAGPAASAQAQWATVGGSRRFAAAYFAEIFHDFDVRLVVRCGGNYDDGPLRAAGIDVEDLPVDPTCPYRLLPAVDRFLTLARSCPGAIALHGGAQRGCGCGDPGAEDLGGVEVLASAFLIRRHGLDGAAAVAWFRMVHPGSAASAGHPVSFARVTAGSPLPPPPPPPAHTAMGGADTCHDPEGGLGELQLDGIERLAPQPPHLPGSAAGMTAWRSGPLAVRRSFTLGWPQSRRPSVAEAEEVFGLRGAAATTFVSGDAATGPPIAPPDADPSAERDRPPAAGHPSGRRLASSLAAAAAAALVAAAAALFDGGS